jgi:hypothetical protein
MKIKKLKKYLEAIRLDLVNWEDACPCRDKDCPHRICQAYQKLIKLQEKIKKEKQGISDCARARNVATDQF